MKLFISVSCKWPYTSQVMLKSVYSRRFMLCCIVSWRIVHNSFAGLPLLCLAWTFQHKFFFLFAEMEMQLWFFGRRYVCVGITAFMKCLNIRPCVTNVNSDRQAVGTPTLTLLHYSTIMFFLYIQRHPIMWPFYTRIQWSPSTSVPPKLHWK